MRLETLYFERRWSIRFIIKSCLEHLFNSSKAYLHISVATDLVSIIVSLAIAAVPM